MTREIIYYRWNAPNYQTSSIVLKVCYCLLWFDWLKYPRGIIYFKCVKDILPPDRNHISRVLMCVYNIPWGIINYVHSCIHYQSFHYILDRLYRVIHKKSNPLSNADFAKLDKFLMFTKLSLQVGGIYFLKSVKYFH